MTKKAKPAKPKAMSLGDANLATLNGAPCIHIDGDAPKPGTPVTFTAQNGVTYSGKAGEVADLNGAAVLTFAGPLKF
tara:strand:- start:167 stop:397 length:231 start_codon:yes stop_codon:yes gene_type:complete